MKNFASDNTSAVHPLVMQAIADANIGSADSYGYDEYTAKAQELFQLNFGSSAKGFVVFSGTAANVLALKSQLRPFEAVICASSGHVNTSETGAFEAQGYKLYAAPAVDGKLTIDGCQGILDSYATDEHCARPRILTLTQSTEYATVYSLDELREISAFCRKNNLLFHMDGARISNAAAHLGVTLKELTVNVGVDMLSLGGTKNGLMFGEAVIFMRPELAQNFHYYRKQGLNLASKARYLSAQFIAYLTDELWRKNALQANTMARLLAEKISASPKVKLAHPVVVNAVFASMPEKAMHELWKKYKFYVWDHVAGEDPVVRLMTSFSTTEEDILEFASDIINSCL